MTDAPIKLQCPNCKKILKLKRAVPAGKKLTCPSCETVFTATNRPAPRPKTEPAQKSRRPRTESKPVPQAQSNSPSPLLIAGIVGLALVLIAGGIGVGIMMSRGSNSQVASNEDEKDKPGSQSEDKGNQTTKTDDSDPNSNGLVSSGESNDDRQSSKSSEPNRTEPNRTEPNRSEPNRSEPNNNSNAKIPSNEIETGKGGLGPSDDIRPPNPTNDNLAKDNPNQNDAFDPNRPTAKPNNGLNPNQPANAGQNAAVNGGGNNTPIQNMPAPIIIEVPVLIPVNFGASTKAKPVVNVVIQAVDASATTLIVDHQTKPGISDEMTVTLDVSPDSDVTITIAEEQGLAVDNKTLTFKKGVAPKKQSVKVNGDGKANLGSGPTKILFLTVSASGAGLDALAPAKIPVKVVRRNEWTESGSGFGVKLVAATRIKKAFWQTNGKMFPARFAIPTNDAYTREFLELTDTAGLKFRFFSDRMETETSVGSGIFKTTLASGSWR